MITLALSLTLDLLLCGLRGQWPNIWVKGALGHDLSKDKVKVTKGQGHLDPAFTETSWGDISAG